ncbi:translation elongation factor Ts [Enterobacteriaceae endosymbiont of Macroplea appendiculata]|uniref:translation elongation factor Ts n=1 Tax=Enterobacteriaceae endosymbiont of Macroplea appendiculata TaxID=2675790 RepID=UPI0014494A19|nr:translation elongation factor Ts [Enterobacteriaceae endosymbiont of Macroplea appendiculata]QJC30844.1 translation elongation factor Ts [Enterobacteriaceae endosymbiont of Macroplea appendiculata]
MKITVTKIKKLRALTGIGIIECKQALLQTKGDIALAVDYIRKNLKLHILNNISQTTTEGFIIGLITKDLGILLEINCQTDFVARNTHLYNFANDILQYVKQHPNTNIIKIRNIFKKKLLYLINIIKENIILTQLEIIQGVFIGSYIHHNKRIGVILQSNLDNQSIMKKIAMHIAVLKPRYISKHDIPQNIIDKEYQIQKSLVQTLNKPKMILNKIINGRINKFINNITLNNQYFLLDTTKLVANYLHENNMVITKFLYLELGQNTKIY